MEIEMDLYIALLSSQEYAPYLIHKTDGTKYIDMKNIPKKSYKPLNGDYVAGFKLVNRINDADFEGNLLKVEPVKE